MNNKFKLPKIDILFQVITYIRSMILPILIIVINLFRKVEWWIPVVSISAVIGLLTVLAFFSWRNFAYLFEKDRIVIYSGMFQKKEKTIYYSRIHSVNISQNIVHRLLGIANLTIETPGVAGAGADGEVRCLSLDKAKYLQGLLQKMGEASRSEDEDKKLVLLNSIILNMENATSRQIVVTEQAMEHNDASNAKLEGTEAMGDGVDEVNDYSSILAPITIQPDVQLRLKSELMLKSAFTSLNINIVLVWFAGLFAFADDIFNTFFPETTFFEDIFSQFDISQGLIVVIVILLVGAIIMTWLLSIALYFIKFFDYSLERNGKQISVSYGLFNRQRIVFDETKVQSLVFEENPLRQWMGYGEIKVNIVRSVDTTNQVDSSYIVIHPFIKKSEMRSYLEQLMPKCNIEEHEETVSLPKKSLYTYLLVPMVLSIIPAVATAYWLQFIALYLLVLPVIVFLLRYAQFRSAAYSIDGTELKVVTRSIAKTTVFIKRSKLISMEERISPYQRKHGLGKISVSTLGGLISRKYALNGIKAEQIKQTRIWLQQYIQK